MVLPSSSSFSGSDAPRRQPPLPLRKSRSVIYSPQWPSLPSTTLNTTLGLPLADRANPALTGASPGVRPW